MREIKILKYNNTGLQYLAQTNMVINQEEKGAYLNHIFLRAIEETSDRLYWVSEKEYKQKGRDAMLLSKYATYTVSKLD